MATYPTGNKQGTWRYFNISTGKPISHKEVTNVPIPIDLPNRIHTLAANNSEDFIILDNHGNPFITSDDLVDDSSIDTDSVEVETVDNDNDNPSSDSEDDSTDDDDSSDDESENSGVSDRRLSKEGVSKTDRQESKEQQAYFNLRSACGTRGNLSPPRASHRSGLRQS